jgi:hypothetical protein
MAGSFSPDSCQYRSRFASRSRSSTSAIPCTRTIGAASRPLPVGSEKSNDTFGFARASHAFFG